MKTPREQMADLKSECEAIVARADSQGRDITQAELDRVNECVKQHGELKDRAEKVEKGQALIASLAGTPTGPGSGSPDGKAAPGSRWAKSVAQHLDLKVDGGGRVQTTDGRGPTFAQKVLSAPLDVPAVVDVVDLPAHPQVLLDLVGRFTLPSAPEFMFLRQTRRDMNAAVVGDGKVKPVSDVEFAEVRERARIIAHLSQKMPLRYLDDYGAVMDILDAQLVTGVLQKLEQQVLAGVGQVGDEPDDQVDEFTGLMNTSGILAQPFDTDVVTTIRRARSRLEALPETPTAVVMNPDDKADLELLREDGGSGPYMDQEAIRTLFGNLPVVLSHLLPRGKAIVGDFRQVQLGVVQGAQTLAATQAGDLWETNRFMLRTEGRFGLRVVRPQAFVVASIAAV